MGSVRISVKGLPPKKDGANSMWRKGAELPRLKNLRRAAREAWGRDPPVESGEVRLSLRLFADPSAGDLDNFITGTCDGLMACHPRVPIDDSAWLDMPEDARPRRAIVFTDDRLVSSIDAKRLPPEGDGPRFELRIEW
jgi:hypothetical protein